MKKYLAGSAVAMLFDTDDQLIGISTTQINNSITLSVQSEEVRSGYGAALDYIYYHSSAFEGQLEDTQFNLDYIAKNIGATVAHSGSYYTSVSVTVAAKGSDTTFTASDFTGKYVWAYVDGKPYSFEATYRNNEVTIANTAKLDELAGKKICFKYLGLGSGDTFKQLTVASDFVPAVIKIVLEAKLFASETGAQNSSNIGLAQFVIPRAQLTGGQEISMTSTGVSTTPLSYMALKTDKEVGTNDNACLAASGIYGYITEITYNGVWYNGIKQLAIAAEGDTLKLAEGDVINTYAIAENEVYLIKPTNRLVYGYGATQSISAMTWGTSANTYIDANGKIQTGALATLKGKYLGVKVVDSAGNLVNNLYDTALVEEEGV